MIHTYNIISDFLILELILAMKNTGRSHPKAKVVGLGSDID